MTLSAAANRVSYAGDGSTTSFAFAFTIWAAAEMKVYLVSSAGVATLKTLTTHYTLSPSSYPATGNVVMVTAPAVGETLVLVRLQALSQALDLVNGDPMPSDLIERRFDILTGIIQNLSERLDRALTLPVQSSLTGIEYPEPTSAEDGYGLVWDDASGSFTLNATISAAATVSAFGATLIDDANAATALTTLGISAFAQTILDDTTTAAARTTLDIKECLIIAVSDETTAITTGTAKVTFRMPYAFTLTEIPRASLSTASSSGAPQVDINEAGASILSTKLTIDANEKTSTTAATAAVLSDSSLADDAEITIDIDTAGTGAKGLKVYLIGRRT